MSTKKAKIKKPTVESRLRTRVTELEELNAQGSAGYQKLLEQKKKNDAIIRALFVFVHKSVAEISKADALMRNAVYAYDQARIKTVDELSIEEISAAIMQAFLALSKDFAREDEGTALLTEHKADLMDVIGMLTNHDNRQSPRIERLAVLSHNIELSKKNNQLINIDHMDQYRDNNSKW